jgi:PAS domain S-box-containing protein
VVAGLAGEHSRALTRRAEESLSRGLRHLSIASILLLGGFVALGGMISRKVRQQITALAQLRRQNEMILNSAGEGILGLDRLGRTIFVNPAGESLLGWDEGSAIGRDHREILRYAPADPDDNAPADGCPIGAILTSGTDFHMDDRHFCRRDGSRFPVEYTATPIRNDEGDIEGAVVTLLDITERKETENALQESYRELDALNRTLEDKVSERTRMLEEKNRQLIRTQEELVRKEQLAAVGSLAAGVAHELNHPTAIIRGNGEILLRKLSAEAPGREEVGEILKNTERISRITQNLLIFAREQVINPEEVQVNHLLLDILAQVPHQVSCGDVEFIREFARDLPALYGDKVKLRQVLNNIVLNALQAMEGKGTLTVATGLREGEIEMRVRDSGPGISAELKGRIFNPFFTTKRTGTGLGLSVSYGIVQAMGGSIDVESTPGEGATFIVRLPCGG